MERFLVVVRHGESEGNASDIFTGWNDPGLTTRGVAEANEVARILGDTRFDVAFTSALRRAQDTLRLILRATNQTDVLVVSSDDLNERHYGQLTGVTKKEARRIWGEDQIVAWQRSYDLTPPGGESLRDTLARVAPYYLTVILPNILRGQRTIIAAHGNSLRALIMCLEGIPRDRISGLEIPTGAAISYYLRADGTVERRASLTANNDGISRPR